MAARVNVEWNSGALALVQERFEQRMLAMAYDIAYKARQKAPVDTGNLKASIRVEINGLDVNVLAGGNSGGGVVRYARKREFENRKNPQTIGYMRNSFTETFSGDWQTKYFGEFI